MGMGRFMIQKLKEIKKTIKNDFNQELFNGFIDELFEYENYNITDYYKGRLIAKLFIYCGEFSDE